MPKLIKRTVVEEFVGSAEDEESDLAGSDALDDEIEDEGDDDDDEDTSPRRRSNRK
jgi:hypothetical protein